MKTILTIDNKRFRIFHEQCSELGKGQNDAKTLLIQDDMSENNILTKIEIFGHDKALKTIYFHWEQINYIINDFGLLYVKETDKLFLGGGKVSFCINLSDLKIVEERYNDCMFWSFERYHDFIIELDELDCHLFNLEGKFIAECPVDPPYEMEYCENGIKFTSPVYGETWLRFQ